MSRLIRGAWRVVRSFAGYRQRTQCTSCCAGRRRRQTSEKTDSASKSFPRADMRAALALALCALQAVSSERDEHGMRQALRLARMRAPRERRAPGAGAGRAQGMRSRDFYGGANRTRLWPRTKHLQPLLRGRLRASFLAPRAQVETLRHAVLHQAAQNLRLRARRRRGRVHRDRVDPRRRCGDTPPGVGAPRAAFRLRGTT